jgi:hypothetical protein
MSRELLIDHKNSVSLYSTVIPYDGFFNEEDVRKILARFEKEETVLTRSGQRVTDDFRKSIRKISGKKEDYMQLSFQEKAAEARERIIKDLKVAREEIKTRNPVDYLLDRALDPLDPMNVFYKTVLKKMGAEVNEETNTIRLSPQLTAIYERKGNTMNIEDQNMPQQLPSFRGYIIDKRLREFRKIEFGRMPEFIPFESPQGQNILMDMAKGRGIPYNSPDFETKVLKQFTDNTIIARIEQIQTDKTAKTSEIILKTNSEKLSLTINEKQARKLSEGAEIVISRNENGIKINVLNVERSRTLKR